MFRKILIANRGEIACRVIDTARKLGVRTVAVYSDADAHARHVEMADEAICLGPPPVGESYLRIDRVIAAAKTSGAQAIHPGYGFLSENPEFVEAVEAAGLVFIGPSAQAIRAMGLKDAAKTLMEKAGVPVVPGYHGADQDDALLRGQADKIGYPVLIKAVAGGGGKGMRRVDVAPDFDAALSAARSEALNAFGNADVLIEKFVTNPRHIEIQVFGDGKNAVHLFERDCSLQRRHQKVIEEAPAPGMSDDVRAKMGQAAVRAAEAIAYAGAGTIEFIVDGSGPLRPDGFWFMEMNTRLQVEHPVTEAITGIDLVEWQLRVAAGQALPLKQQDITCNGHAFEARIYAEDAARGFLPATGTLSQVDFAQSARIDTGIRAGDTISPYYDPMIAKLTVHGQDRASALSALSHALEDTAIAGSTTNLNFLARLAAHPEFVQGGVDTGLIEREIAPLTAVKDPSSDVIALAALAALNLPRPGATGFTLWAPLRHCVRLEHRGDHIDCIVTQSTPGSFVIDVAGVLVHLSDVAVSGGICRYLAKTGRMSVFLDHNGARVTLTQKAEAFVFNVYDPLLQASADVAGGDTITAPMPGLIKSVFVEAGQTVENGSPLLVLEAMKMEHSLVAPRDGRVAAISHGAGTQVQDGDILLTLEAEDD